MIKLSDIKVADRYRRENTNVEALAESIKQWGLFNPLLVDADWNLVQGGRRHAAITSLGMMEIPDDWVRFRGQEDAGTRKILELEENLQREDVPWQDTCRALAELHELYKRKALSEDGHQWTFRHMGKLMGVSYAHIAHAVHVAPMLEDEEIYKSSSMSHAYKVLCRRKEDLAKALVAQKLVTKRPAAAKKQITVIDFSDLNDERPRPQRQEAPQQKSEEVVISLSSMFHLEDSVYKGMPAMAKRSVDHIITDPPFAIDMDDLETRADITRVVDEHDVEENLQLLQDFLVQAYRVLKPTGVCVFWMDLTHWEKITMWAEKVGFRAQRWPMVWCKKHMCKNIAAEKNVTKATEYAFVAYMPKHLIGTPVLQNYLLADGSGARRMHDHPFVKPFDVWKWLIEAFTYKGQEILDPFAGEMTCPMAVLQLDRRPLAFEKIEKHFNGGMVHVQKMLQEAFGNVVFE